MPGGPKGAPGTFKIVRQNRPDAWKSAAVAEQTQEEQEHVDEVEIQRQRAENDRLARKIATLDLVIHQLQLLRIPRGETSEDQHAKDADREVQTARLEEKVDDRGQDDPDQAHRHEGAHPRKIALRGVADEAEPRERAGRGEEGLGNRAPGI